MMSKYTFKCYRMSQTQNDYKDIVINARSYELAKFLFGP